MMDRTTIPRIKPMGRCKITNGTKMLAGVDGRSHIARRLRDIVNGLLIEFPVTGEANCRIFPAVFFDAKSRLLRVAISSLIDKGQECLKIERLRPPNRHMRTPRR
jgi:hypothetical protein